MYTGVGDMGWGTRQVLQGNGGTAGTERRESNGSQALGTCAGACQVLSHTYRHRCGLCWTASCTCPCQANQVTHATDVTVRSTALQYGGCSCPSTAVVGYHTLPTNMCCQPTCPSRSAPPAASSSFSERPRRVVPPPLCGPGGSGRAAAPPGAAEPCPASSAAAAPWGLARSRLLRCLHLCRTPFRHRTAGSTAARCTGSSAARLWLLRLLLRAARSFLSHLRRCHLPVWPLNPHQQPPHVRLTRSLVPL